MSLLTHVFFCVSKNVSVSCAYTQGKREQFSGFNRTLDRSEERFSRNAETDLVCRLLLEKKKRPTAVRARPPAHPARRPRAAPPGAALSAASSSRRASAALAGPADRASVLFFFAAPAPTEIYTLSLHDALPIF